VNLLYELYGHRIEFLWVYIREAHPSDGSQVRANIDEGIILPTPQTLKQREDYARQAAEYLDIEFTNVIDTMDDHVESLYAPWPLRLYLVGEDGRLTYVGKPGPAGYRPAELEGEIRGYLGLEGVTCTSAASYSPSVAAPESVVATFGPDLAPVTEAADSTALPTSLAGTSVTVTDSGGVERVAPLFFVSRTQANFLVPAETAAGPAVVTVNPQDGGALLGPLLIRDVAPALFTANRDGIGVPAALLVRVAVDGSQVVDEVFRLDEGTGRFVRAITSLGGETDQAVLILFGTGMRHASATPTVTVGGESGEVLYSGLQPEYPGLDQVNVLLPRSLVGRGAVDVLLTADGMSANPVTITIGQ
jgi:uncharacterized protein (TIGR03437 family)